MEVIWIEIHREELFAAWYAYNNDEEKRYFDVKPYLSFKPFEKLKDVNKFKNVKIDGLSIKWENRADICPNELYNNSYKSN